MQLYLTLLSAPEVLIILHLEKDEAEHGLIYTAFSRATRFSYVGIFDGFESLALRKRFLGMLKWLLVD